MNQTPEQSLALLSEMLNPPMVPKLTRGDYVNAQNALNNLADALNERAELKKANKAAAETAKSP